MDSLRAVFVWAVWAGMTGLAWWFIAHFGSRIPVIDDYFTVDLRLTAVPAWHDLWAQLNEHRVPLPKLVSWASAKVFGVGMKSQMLVDLGIVAALAAGLLVMARRIRGHTAFADAFLPLVLLSVGQADNFLWAVQINFFLPLALQGWFLILLARTTDRISPLRALGFAACVVGLTLCGIQGIVTALPLAAWLAYAGWCEFRAGARGVAAGLILAGVSTVAVAAANFVGYEQPPHAVAPRFGWAEVRYTLRALGGAWGPVAEDVGPTDATGWPPALGVATFLLIVATSLRLLLAALDPRNRPAAVGMLAFVVGFVALAAGIAYGRAGLTEGALAYRYITLTMPVLVWAYLAWLRFGPPTILNALFLAAAVFAWPNAAVGFERARMHHTFHTLVERDILVAVPASGLAAHHGWLLMEPEPYLIPPAFEKLRSAGVSPFNRIAPEPSRLTDLPTTWRYESASPAPDADGWVRTGETVEARFALAIDAARPFVAVRIRYSFDGEKTKTDGDAFWDATGPDGQSLPRRVARPFHAPGPGQEKTLWLGGGVTRVTFVVRGRLAVRIETVTAVAAD